MATPNVDFSDIRVIICMQGYNFDFQYIVREIGFWCNGQSGSIPFNVKLNKNHLDVKNQQIVSYCEEEINGIKLKRNFDNALASSDIKPVLRTLFHLNNNSKAKYIGITKDDNLDGLIYKSGLGNYVFHLENLSPFKQSNIQLPNNDVIRQYLKKYSDRYVMCPIHDRLRINENPICAKTKAEILADFCKNLNQNNPPSVIIDNSKQALQNLLYEFDFVSPN